MGDAPYRLGHEGAGTVEAVGEGVEGFAVGDRVVPANSASCGTCALCVRGMTAQCADMVWLRGTYAVLGPGPGAHRRRRTSTGFPTASMPPPRRSPRTSPAC